MKTVSEEKLLTVDEVADFLRCCKRTVQTLVAARKIPKPKRVGRKSLWSRVKLEAWAKE